MIYYDYIIQREIFLYFSLLIISQLVYDSRSFNVKNTSSTTVILHYSVLFIPLHLPLLFHLLHFTESDINNAEKTNKPLSYISRNGLDAIYKLVWCLMTVFAWQNVGLLLMNARRCSCMEIQKLRFRFSLTVSGVVCVFVCVWGTSLCLLALPMITTILSCLICFTEHLGLCWALYVCV